MFIYIKNASCYQLNMRKIKMSYMGSLLIQKKIIEL